MEEKNTEEMLRRIEETYRKRADQAQQSLSAVQRSITRISLLRVLLFAAGITVNEIDPDYVVIGEPESFSYDNIVRAIRLVNKGAKLIGANSDVSGPIERGIAPACRALTAPIELATGKQAYFCGKPNPLMMRTGLHLLGCHSEDAVLVGDRMDTDIVSGTETGVDTVLVLSGCSTRETVDTYAYRPTMILDGVGDIVRLDNAQKAAGMQADTQEA